MKEYKKRIADKLLRFRLEEVGAVLVEVPSGAERQLLPNSKQKVCCTWRILTIKTAI